MSRVCLCREGVDRLCTHPDPIYLVTPYPAAPTPSCVVLQVSVDGPEAETQAEETPGSLHQVINRKENEMRLLLEKIRSLSLPGYDHLATK